MITRRQSQSKTPKERRSSDRWPTDGCLSWRVYRGRKIRRSRVFERSLEGLAMIARQEDEPTVGTRVCTCDSDEQVRFGFQYAIVRRVEALSKDIRLVYVEIEA